MSEKSNAVVRKFYALLDKGDMGGVGQLLSDNFVWRIAGIPAPLDKQGAVGFLQAFRAAFPDMRHSLDPQVAEGDRVVTPLTFRATHRANCRGSQPVRSGWRSWPSTFTGSLAGRSPRRRPFFDMMSHMQQVGAIPAPGGAGA